MYFEQFSILELEKHLEEIEAIEEKIDFISDEILRCEKVVQEIQFDSKVSIPIEIKFTVKQNGTEQKLIDLLNKDTVIKQVAVKKVIKVCKEKLFERNRHFLKRARLLREHYQLKFDLIIKSNGIHQNNNYVEPSYKRNGIIVWMSGKEKLLNMFIILNENGFLPMYTEKEILTHFSNEKQVPFINNIINPSKLVWLDSDNSFSIFVDELAKRGAIDDGNKYKVFEKHFLNRNGKPFKNLPQKKNYTKNFTLTGNLIGQILDLIKL